jgi:hypothetical protein
LYPYPRKSTLGANYMQTFLPYIDFTRSLKCLDMKRLGKQRVEAKQILDILTGKAKSKAWANHPAVLMWNGHEAWLADYYNRSIDEWISRGYKNTMPKIEVTNACEYVPEKSRFVYFKMIENCVWSEQPHFITAEFCKSHQSNLIRKKPEYYRPIFGNDIPDNLEYIWPVRK